MEDVPDGPQRRPGGRTARTRRAVLVATLEELAEGGYARLSLERVAARAGVHKTTVYRRWRNRAGLVAEALGQLSRERVPIPVTGDLESDLVELATSVRDNISSPLTHAIVSAITGEGDAPELAMVADRFWAERFGRAEAIVERAVARDQFPPSADPTLIIELLIAPLYLRLLITRQPTSDAHIAAIAERLVSAYSSELGGPTAGSRPVPGTD